MTEKIISIREITNIKASPNEYDKYDGWQVLTTKQAIRLLISNEQQCCEGWGYGISEDNPEDFIGAELVNVQLVDADGNVTNHAVEDDDEYDEGAAVFVNFVTDRGVFQITLYNAHNGYYGHAVIVQSDQVKLETSL